MPLYGACGRGMLDAFPGPTGMLGFQCFTMYLPAVPVAAGFAEEREGEMWHTFARVVAVSPRLGDPLDVAGGGWVGVAGRWVERRGGGGAGAHLVKTAFSVQMVFTVHLLSWWAGLIQF